MKSNRSNNDNDIYNTNTNNNNNKIIDRKEEEEEEEEENFEKLKKLPIEHTQKLTKEDEEVIKYLKIKLGEERINKCPLDVIIRFVRGYAHVKDRKIETVDRLRYFLEYYEKYHTSLDEPWPKEQECLEAWPVFFYGIDHQGHPILYDEICCSDPSYVESVFRKDMDKINTFRLRLMQRMAIRKEYLSKKYSVMIYKHVVIMDVSKASMSSLNRFKNLIQACISQEQHIFPETLHKLYIIKASWTFQMLWKIVSKFVDPLTYQKVQVLGNNYLPEILKIADKDQIPIKYGGTGKKLIVYGQDSEDYEEGEEKPSMKKRSKNELQPLTEPKKQSLKGPEKEQNASRYIEH